jgi:IS5 family transposase
MLGKQDDHNDLFQLVTMEDLVPAGHALRKLRAVLNLEPVIAKVTSRYSKIGRPSLDPSVVARLWVLQHLYGLSERQVCDELRMHAGFRWFCGLSFNDPVPDQSTLVKLRNEKWAGTEFWQELLSETVRACEAAGLCKPERMGIDGTLITANAATVSLEQIPPPLTVSPAEPKSDNTPDAPAPTPVPPPSLRVVSGERKHDKHKSGDPDWHGEKFSNATHRSTTDPEARLYRKGQNQEAKLRYIGHYLAALGSGVIYAASATQATGHAEREAALALLDGLAHKPQELVADLGYRDADFLADVLERGVQPIVPISQEPQESLPTWKRRTFDFEQMCERHQRMRAAHARNRTRRAAAGRRGVRAQRQRTRLEHLFAEGKDHHGLGRARSRGLVKVDQQVKLTAAVQNLKRLLTLRPKRRGCNEAANSLLKAISTGSACLVTSRQGHNSYTHQNQSDDPEQPSETHSK